MAWVPLDELAGPAGLRRRAPAASTGVRGCSWRTPALEAGTAAMRRAARDRARAPALRRLAAAPRSPASAAAASAPAAPGGRRAVPRRAADDPDGVGARRHLTALLPVVPGRRRHPAHHRARHQHRAARRVDRRSRCGCGRRRRRCAAARDVAADPRRSTRRRHRRSSVGQHPHRWSRTSCAPGAAAALHPRASRSPSSACSSQAHRGRRARRRGARPRRRAVDESTPGTGVTRTFLPWFPAGPTGRARPGGLAVAADRPARRGLADGVFLDDQLAVELSPGGRLDRLLDARRRARRRGQLGGRPGAAADRWPDMTDGYEVPPGRRPRRRRPRGAGAGTWLARLRTLTARAEVTRARRTPTPTSSRCTAPGLTIDIALAAHHGRATCRGALLGAPGRRRPRLAAGRRSTDAAPSTCCAPPGATRRGALRRRAAAHPDACSYTPSGSVDLATGGVARCARSLTDPGVSRSVAARSPPRSAARRRPGRAPAAGARRDRA